MGKKHVIATNQEEAIKETEKESKTEEMLLGPDNMAEPVILIDEKLSENQHETFVENEIAVTEIDPLNIEDRDGKAKKKKKC